MRFIFEQIRVGGDSNFGYLLGDREAGVGVLIDPSYTPEAVVERARVQGLKITHILNTHGHPDHTNGNEVAKALTGAMVAGGPGHPGPVGVPAVQDREQGPAEQLRVLVGLGEPTGSHPGPEPGHPGVRHRPDLDLADRAVLDVGVGPPAS